MAGAAVRLPVRADAPERRRLGRPVLRRGGGQGDRVRTWSPGAIVVNKSTVPVGSATMVEQVIGRPDISVVSNPEFLREGTAVLDSLNPDRIVVGRGRRPGGGQGGRAVLLDRRAAHRDRRHDVGDDQVRVQRLPGHQAELRQRPRRPVRGGRRGRPRRAARAGLRQAHRLRVPPARARAGAARACPRTPARCSTSPGRRATTSRCWPVPSPPTTSSCPGWWPRSRRPAAVRLDGATIGVWGLTFKANTDDRRDSPSLQIAHRLADLGATVQAFDPTVDAETDGPDDLHGPAPAGRPLRGGHRGPGPGGADRVGRVPLARLRPCARAPWPSPTSSTPATCSTRPPSAAWASRYTGIGRQ